jgi:hypothetical protein
VARLNGFEPPYANVTVLCELATAEGLLRWMGEREVGPRRRRARGPGG